MTPWTVKICTQAEPEILALPDDIRARFLRTADVLARFGPHEVGMPLIRHLDGKLWEMRMQGRDGIARAIYAAVQGRTLLVLHAFIKKTQATPRAAIELARKRLETEP